MTVADALGEIVVYSVSSDTLVPGERVAGHSDWTRTAGMVRGSDGLRSICPRPWRSSWEHCPRMLPKLTISTGQSIRMWVRMVLTASLVALPVAAQAVTIELKDVAPDRVERQRKFVEGSLPLPETPDLSRLDERLSKFGATAGSPMLIRIFKAESQLEVWMRKGETFEHFATYPICHWSGTLGPKIKEGDKQTPEGFYTVTQRQLHRIGRHPRSLNLGFPNAFDKSQSRTGSYILVHGACSSVGCFAMTNAVIEEIYGLTSASIKAGQANVPVHVFPFRMTEANLEKHKSSPWIDFWNNLKRGHDAFESSRRVPRVSVCNNRYEFADPAPGEGGEASPLAVCGATVAAIENLAPLYNSAALQPALWKQALDLLSPSQLEAFGKRRNLVAPRLATNRADPLPLPASARLHATALAGLPNAISTAKCSPGRASCRRFVALQYKKVAKPRRVRSAASAR